MRKTQENLRNPRKAKKIPKVGDSSKKFYKKAKVFLYFILVLALVSEKVAFPIHCLVILKVSSGDFSSFDELAEV